MPGRAATPAPRSGVQSDHTAASLSADVTISPTATASNTSRLVTAARVLEEEVDRAGAGQCGLERERDDAAERGGRDEQVGEDAATVGAGPPRPRTPGGASSAPPLQGPSPTVNCSRSAVSASSRLPPSGTRSPAESTTLRLAASTPSISAQARASRTGSSSGPSRPGASVTVSAVWNRAAMLTPHDQGRRRGPRFQSPRPGTFPGLARWPIMTGVDDDAGAGAVLDVLPYGDRALLVEVADLAGVAALSASSRARRRCPASGSWSRPPAPSSCSWTGRRPRPTWPGCAGWPPRRRRRPRTSRRSTCRSASTGPTWRRSPSSPAGRSPPWSRPSWPSSSPSRSAGSRPASATSPDCPRTSTCPAAPPRAPASRPGSVGLAGPFAGAYPRSSPGGWQLIGRTDAVLFDVDRAGSGAAAARCPGPVPGGGLTC